MRHRWSALLAVLAILAAIPLLAPPAHACSCAHPDIDQALHQGDALAVVTRTDHRLGTDATFRVERALGADLPTTLTGQVDSGMDCHPQVFPEQVAAMVLHRGTTWLIRECSQEDLDAALARTEGPALEESGREAVAVVAGSFADSRLVAVDHNGAVVAWDRHVGRGEKATLCSGGPTIAAVGIDPVQGTVLTILWAPALRTSSTVPLGLHDGESVAAMQCADAVGRTVRLLIADSQVNDPGTARLLTVTDGIVSARPVLNEELHSTSWIRDGFLAVTNRDDAPAVHRISYDGVVTDVSLSVDLGSVGQLVASHDGRTVALVGYDRSDPKATVPPLGSIYVIDAATGKVLAQRRLAAEQRVDLGGWSPDGHLLARIGYTDGYGQPYSTGVMHLFNDRLVVLRTWPGQPGFGVASVGDSVVSFGLGRMRATPARGDVRVFDNLWLTQATQVVGLTTEGFQPGTAEAPAKPSSVVKAVSSLPTNSTDDPAPYVLIGLAMIVGGILLGRRLSSGSP